MLNRIIKTVMGMTLSTAIAFSQAQPQVKDQGEYDIMTSISKEQDPTKRLALLDQWKEKYPDTQFKQNRDINYIQTYPQIAQAAAAPTASPEVVAAGQKAANTIIEQADSTLFSADKKPAQVTDQQWADAKKDTVATAHGVLGAIATNKKDFPAAEEEYKKLLAVKPDDASISYYLGTAILQQKKVDRYPEVIYEYARAVSLTGPGAWKDETAKKSIGAYLDKIYTNYHGDLKGLDDVKAKAVLAPLPPADFKIESITEISQKAIGDATAFAAQFPEIMTWRGLKEGLQTKGDELFKEMKGADVDNLKGKVVAQPSPKELTVSMDYADPKTAETADLTLKFDTPLKGTVDKGTLLTFSAVPESYTKEPFMLICTAEKAKVQGLGDAAGPPEVKKPVIRKKAVTKKKAT